MGRRCYMLHLQGVFVLMLTFSAFTSTCIRKGVTVIEKYPGTPDVVADMTIAPTLTGKLNKLKKVFPEAFYYWAKTSQLLQSE